MVNHYYLAKGLNKIAQGWHEVGEDAVALSIYRYIIAMQSSNPAETFGNDTAEFSTLLEDYAALLSCRKIDEKELVRN
ncbi:MAG: hypothetical protein WCT03_25205 [Candidatus Obscuribacterales bacterium]|jgi:hypothetical protein